jgi:hypothetical protein
MNARRNTRILPPRRKMSILDLYSIRNVGQGRSKVEAIGKISWFGGSADTQDNGETACGESTINNPTPYIALPIPVWEAHSLECGIAVYVSALNNKIVRCKLLDKGPSERLRRVADVAPTVFEQLGIPLEQGVFTGMVWWYYPFERY